MRVEIDRRNMFPSCLFHINQAKGSPNNESKSEYGALTECADRIIFLFLENSFYFPGSEVFVSLACERWYEQIEEQCEGCIFSCPECLFCITILCSISILLDLSFLHCNECKSTSPFCTSNCEGQNTYRIVYPTTTTSSSHRLWFLVSGIHNDRVMTT